jgi:uncharacterized protein YcbK (DUF882 family)
MSTYVTTHFSWAEFACHCGTEVPTELQPNVRRLCDQVLEPLRERWKGPLIVISGYRTPHYNAMLRHAGHGAAEKSRHVWGEAADIRPVQMDALARLMSAIEEMLKANQLSTLGGLGVYPGWIHVDVRPRGPNNHIARWVGAGVASEP